MADEFDPQTGEEMDLQAFGQMLGDEVMNMVGRWQQNAPRTIQSTMRILGMSEMGGCREYIRATIAGDPKSPNDELKMPALMGTAVGDVIEEAVKEEEGAVTQDTLVLTLPRSGIKITGHSDFRFPNRLFDTKSKDGLETVMRDGPSFKERVQLAGYFLAAVQEGKMTEEGTAHLMYVDRSGRTNKSWVYSMSYETAVGLIEAVEERIDDVKLALATGQSQVHRDEPESWCHAVKCPFFEACWKGYQPTGEITHPDHIAALRNYDAGRTLKKQAEDLIRSAKSALRPNDEKPVEGMSDEFSIKWKLAERDGVQYDTIDVRRRK
jgi:hypothetical protein